MQQPPELASSGILRMYHGTDKRFERFNLDFAARPGMAGNGHLGVWLAARRDLAERFGTICLDVDDVVEKAYIMPLHVLSRLNAEIGRVTRDLADDQVYDAEQRFYAQHRNKLRSEGYDIIYLQEADGHVDMAIGLDPSKLRIQ